MEMVVSAFRLDNHPKVNIKWSKVSKIESSFFPFLLHLNSNIFKTEKKRNDLCSGFKRLCDQRPTFQFHSQTHRDYSTLWKPFQVVFELRTTWVMPSHDTRTPTPANHQRWVNGGGLTHVHAFKSGIYHCLSRGSEGHSSRWGRGTVSTLPWIYPRDRRKRQHLA